MYVSEEEGFRLPRATRPGWRRLLVPLTTTCLLAAALAPFGGVPAALAAPAGTTNAAPAPDAPGQLQAAFSAASQEFGVPERILLAVAYNLSRWDQHQGEPSVAGGYGVMHLTQVSGATQYSQGQAGKGDQAEGGTTPGTSSAGSATSAATQDDPGRHTLDAAAKLLGLDPAVLKRDAAHNIRGAAALLAQYARETNGQLPADEAGWYGAVAKYSGSQEADVALSFADEVYQTLGAGAERQTAEGDQVRLAARSVAPDRTTAQPLALRNPQRSGAECPPGLPCRFIPAAYQQNAPNDPTDYGNYDTADRPVFGPQIRYIVIHDTEAPYQPVIDWWHTSSVAYTSAHYIIRSSDGEITQLVKTKDVAWQAGNWWVNMHSIGIEHEGYATNGTWYTEQMYRASARLVKYLADKYAIPLDRAHIIGHDEVPGLTAYSERRMHWDPGPYWDWDHYMQLMGGPDHQGQGQSQGQSQAQGQDQGQGQGQGQDQGQAQGQAQGQGQDQGQGRGSVVTIHPNFVANQPVMTGLTPQPSNFVYLYSAPSFDAPLIGDSAMAGVDPRAASNWGDKARTGQTYALAGYEGDWTAIWYGGQKAWLYNPYSDEAQPGRALVVKPKAGRGAITVYGAAWPEAQAYPAGIPVRSITSLGYTIPEGQAYAAAEKVRSDYYYANIFSVDPHAYNVQVNGTDEYYRIQFNHRYAFVKASDVDVVGDR
ncbi:MAG: N-acetylmuramoyl-L-alanine amidase [Firmicutes bacterium]|nr:N-acetylmuramoyl-L-alanine amidase [Bacillota bacterium]